MSWLLCRLRPFPVTRVHLSQLAGLYLHFSLEWDPTVHPFSRKVSGLYLPGCQLCYLAGQTVLEPCQRARFRSLGSVIVDGCIETAFPIQSMIYLPTWYTELREVDLKITKSPICVLSYLQALFRRDLASASPTPALPSLWASSLLQTLVLSLLVSQPYGLLTLSPFLFC